jgi:hypothetical protein
MITCFIAQVIVNDFCSAMKYEYRRMSISHLEDKLFKVMVQRSNDLLHNILPTLHFLSFCRRKNKKVAYFDRVKKKKDCTPLILTEEKIKKMLLSWNSRGERGQWLSATGGKGEHSFSARSSSLRAGIAFTEGPSETCCDQSRDFWNSGHVSIEHMRARISPRDGLKKRRRFHRWPR